MMYIEQLAVSLSLMTFGFLWLASAKNFKGLWLNLAPYGSLAASYILYVMADNVDLTLGFIVFLFIVLFLHTLMFLHERR
ncbi:hypothetical protein AL073_09800 [Loktanella sp. 1ANDIMAR09]|nr:hypothetical protein AL073_09800 [Loktanella sp. 1ANDIMAR09]